MAVEVRGMATVTDPHGLARLLQGACDDAAASLVEFLQTECESLDGAAVVYLMGQYQEWSHTALVLGSIAAGNASEYVNGMPVDCEAENPTTFYDKGRRQVRLALDTVVSVAANAVDVAQTPLGGSDGQEYGD